MSKITIDLIAQLQTNGPKASGPVITMYLPTHRAASPPHMREDEVRFKNLAQKASDILYNLDKHDSYNATFAEQCAELFRNELFWKGRAEAVLICARPGQFETYDLTMTSDEYAAVDDHYHLTPIYGLLEDATPFHVLAVTKDGAFLFSGDEYGLQLVRKTQFLNPQHDKNDQYMYEAERHRNLRRVDESFFTNVDRKQPLILAGVESDVAEYRLLSKYPRVLGQHISGSYDADSAHELFPLAVPIVNEEVIESRHRGRLAVYQQLKRGRSELASDELANIKDAAEKGRVETLLIGMSRKTADTIDDSVESVRKITFPGEIESQTIDYLARTVWNQHGHIININVDQLPGSSLLYALYRY